MVKSLFAALQVLVVTALPVYAKDLKVPEGDVILTVWGAVGVTNVDEKAQFDLGMLEALGDRTVETSTIWTDGPQTFQGVSLDLLIERLGASGDVLRASAINDYYVEIPVSDAVEGGPIIAYKMNGNVMSVRDKGPLWVIYPYDADPEYRSEVIYSRSIWQLDRIEVMD